MLGRLGHAYESRSQTEQPMVNHEKTGGTIACASFALVPVIGGSIGVRAGLAQNAVEVTLFRTKWGEAYRLSAEGLHGFIQVEPVR